MAHRDAGSGIHSISGAAGLTPTDRRGPRDAQSAAGRAGRHALVKRGDEPLVQIGRIWFSHPCRPPSPGSRHDSEITPGCDYQSFKLVEVDSSGRASEGRAGSAWAQPSGGAEGRARPGGAPAMPLRCAGGGQGCPARYPPAPPFPPRAGGAASDAGIGPSGHARAQHGPRRACGSPAARRARRWPRAGARGRQRGQDRSAPVDTVRAGSRLAIRRPCPKPRQCPRPRGRRPAACRSISFRPASPVHTAQLRVSAASRQAPPTRPGAPRAPVAGKDWGCARRAQGRAPASWRQTAARGPARQSGGRVRRGRPAARASPGAPPAGKRMHWRARRAPC